MSATPRGATCHYWGIVASVKGEPGTGRVAGRELLFWLIRVEMMKHVAVLLDGAVVEVVHLLNRVVGAPALELHAVDGAVGAGAVLAGEAVQEHRVVGRFGHHLDELLDPLFGGNALVLGGPGFL